MPRVKQRTPQLRDHVVSVAVELLDRQGTAGFTARNVAREAETSAPAVYELFGDKGGLLGEVFFEGFRRLRHHLGTLAHSGDPRTDLVRLSLLYRDFIRANPVLSAVMFSRPFSDFDPGPTELEASSSVRLFVVEHVRAFIDAGGLRGDPTDIAHVLVALVQGLAAAENARRLGTTAESVDRRWTLGVNAVLDGFA